MCRAAEGGFMVIFLFFLKRKVFGAGMKTSSDPFKYCFIIEYFEKKTYNKKLVYCKESPNYS